MVTEYLTEQTFQNTSDVFSAKLRATAANGSDMAEKPKIVFAS